MTPFAYLAVLISIVLGLGVTELLSSFQRLIHARDRVTFHWLPLTWSALIFVALVQWWWAAFGLRNRVEWQFFAFLATLLAPVLLYLAAALVLPNPESSSPFDLRRHYFGIRPSLFFTLSAVSVVDMLRAVVVGDGQAIVLSLTAAVLLTSLALVRSPRYHAIMTFVVGVYLAGFIVLETFRIS